MSLIEKARQFLKDNQIDYLLVNSSNEFLMEYTPLDENSRYLLTCFSGSVGDAVISQKDIFLFVDGRYHKQADLEVDKKTVTVVKMNLGGSFSANLAEKLPPDKTLGIVSKKVSQGQLEILEAALRKKNIKIKLIDFDPVNKGREKRKEERECQKIDKEIAGLSSQEKIKKISKTLKKDEAILFTNLEEVSYLLNLRDFSNNYNSSVRGKCLVSNNPTNHPELVSSSCFRAKLELQGRVSERQSGSHQLSTLVKNVKTVYVDKTSITAYDYALLGDKAVVLKENPVQKMKSVKTRAEIKHYKKCFERTDKAFLETRKFIEQNDKISEYDIAQELEKNFYKFGAKSLSFKSIVAKDKNSAQAHYSKNSKDEILNESSLVLIDCGAYYEGGLATDITRVFVKGEPSKLQRQVYTVVLKGFLKAFRKKITQKTTGFSIDSATRKLLKQKAPEGFEFSHSLGHGIGISVHEAPPRLSFSPLAKTPLKENMCFTIEPGLYNSKKFGVRLENSCYLGKRKKGKGKGELVIKSFSDMCFEKKLIDFDMLTPTEKKQLKKFEVK